MSSFSKLNKNTMIWLKSCTPFHSCSSKGLLSGRLETQELYISHTSGAGSLKPSWHCGEPPSRGSEDNLLLFSSHPCDSSISWRSLACGCLTPTSDYVFTWPSPLCVPPITPAHLLEGYFFKLSLYLFGCTAEVRSQLPNQGSNPRPLYWKMET